MLSRVLPIWADGDPTIAALCDLLAADDMLPRDVPLMLCQARMHILDRRQPSLKLWVPTQFHCEMLLRYERQIGDAVSQFLGVSDATEGPRPEVIVEVQ